jgi:hypothetical protein
MMGGKKEISNFCQNEQLLCEKNFVKLLLKEISADSDSMHLAGKLTLSTRMKPFFKMAASISALLRQTTLFLRELFTTSKLEFL